MKAICWSLTILGSLLGGFILFSGIAEARSAPQQAAAAAMGAACAVIPYCLARAVSELGGKAQAAPPKSPDEPPTIFPRH